MAELKPEFDFMASVLAENNIDPNAAAEEEQEAESAGAEAATADAAAGEEESSAERARDEKGRFAKKDDEAAEEETKLLAGKYRTAEDLERAYLEAQSKINEQGSELGLLRREFEDRFATLEGQTQPRQQYDFSGMIEDDPAQATVLAYQAGDQAALTSAWNAWAEENPAAAAAWRSDAMLAQQAAALRAEFEQRTAPVIQQTEDQQWGRAFAALTRQYPDIEQYTDQMGEIAPNYPAVLAELQSGSPEGKARALEGLYHIARSSNTEAFKQKAAQVTRESAEEAKKAVDDAFVASATATGSHEEPPKTAEEIVYAQMMDDSASLKKNWTRYTKSHP